MRKHVAWYTKGMKGSARFRDMINQVVSYQELEKLLESSFSALFEEQMEA